MKRWVFGGQRLLIGIVGIGIGLAGPYVTTRLLGIPEDEQDENKRKKIISQ